MANALSPRRSHSNAAADHARQVITTARIRSTRLGLLDFTAVFAFRIQVTPRTPSMSQQLPIEIVGVDMELGKLAASLKARHNLPYADCFAAALAQARKVTSVTSDEDFERVGTTLKTLWV